MTIRLLVLGVGVAVISLGIAACGGGRTTDVCSNADGSLAHTTFVFLQQPTSGDRVVSGFHASGCSSTFEANVIWRLRARDGRVLAKGFTQGGSLESGKFAFTVAYALGSRQTGRLEVDAPTATTSEGFPPVQNVVPLVLQPSTPS